MNQKERNILDAARRVFMRYGVKRASIADIAREAGISRQTLYNTFRNKEDVLRAEIQSHAEGAIAEIRAAMETNRNLSDQLDLMFQKLSLEPFDIVTASPNAEEFMEALHATSEDELAAGRELYRKVLVEILNPYRDALKRAGLKPASLAELAILTASSATTSAKNRRYLVQTLNSLKRLILAAADESSA